MFENLLSWLLLPLGVVLGLNLARKREPQNGGGHGDIPPAGGGLARTVESEADVVELQMTLGSLFRKRGDVDRAIRLHEVILARSGLSQAEAAKARLELAEDYLRAGLMDRAEALLHELVDGGQQVAPALEMLLDLYELGRDWTRAIETASRLQSVLGSSLGPRTAHYWCELAENAIHAGMLEDAEQQANRALDADRNCIRASLLLAQMAEKREQWVEAIGCYGRAILQDRRYVSEVLGPLRRCHEASGRMGDYLQLLDDAVLDLQGSIPVVLAKLRLQQEAGSDVSRVAAERFSATPDWRLLLLWLELQTAGDESSKAVLEAARKRLEARPRYSCSSCGLQPSVLFWQCPSCKQWASIAPLSALI